MKRWILIALLGAFTAVLIFLICRIADAEWAVLATWDPVTTNTDGSECTDLAGYEVAITEPTVVGQPTAAQLIDKEMVPGTEPVFPATVMLKNIADGTTLKLWCRAWDLHLNYSAWGIPTQFTINRGGFDQVSPTKPTAVGARNR